MREQSISLLSDTSSSILTTNGHINKKKNPLDKKKWNIHIIVLGNLHLVSNSPYEDCALIVPWDFLDEMYHSLNLQCHTMTAS